MVAKLDRWHFHGRRQQVVQVAGGQWLAGRVVHHLLEQRIADSLAHPAVHLAVDDRWIDDRSAVVDNHIAQQRDDARLDVDFHDRDVHPVGVRVADRMEVVRRLEARLQALREDEGRRRRADHTGDPGQADLALGHTAHPDDPLPKLEVLWTVSSICAAIRIALSRTARAATLTALPATTALRLA